MINAKQISAKYLSKVKPTIFDRGAAVRLPEEYRKFYREWLETTPQPVHYIPEKGNWKKLETGEMKRIENVPLPGKMTKELHEVITGGEMIIQGFKQRHRRARRNPTFWIPSVRKSVIYSEILNKHISVLITERAIGLIMEHEGFDSYALKTKACDLGSLLSIRLKRKLLLALRDKDLPYDEEKNNMLLEKYKDCLLPPKEIEWYGLTMLEALQKLYEEEWEINRKNIVPLKHYFRSELFNYLKTKEGKKT